jgi:hypothetical protein
MAHVVEIYVRLLDEGTECSRPTVALDLGDGLFKVLATQGYSAEDEHWEFPPDSIVRCEWKSSVDGTVRLAVAAGD